MAQVLIQDVAEDTVAKLKDRASHHGRSLQQELRLILEEAARQNSAEPWEAIHQFPSEALLNPRIQIRRKRLMRCLT